MNWVWMIRGPLRTVRTIALFTVVLVAAGAVHANPLLPAGSEEVPSGIALRLLLAELGERPISEWSGADQIAIWELNAAAEQELATLTRVSSLSWIVPGLGHIAVGESGAGSLFLLADLVLAAATTWVSLLVLPAPLRPENAPYLALTFQQIDDLVKQVTPSELIPSLATLVIGGSAGLVLRSISSHGAVELQRELLFTEGSESSRMVR